MANLGNYNLWKDEMRKMMGRFAGGEFGKYKYRHKYKYNHN